MTYGILVPWPGIENPWLWERRVLTTGPAENSLKGVFLFFGFFWLQCKLEGVSPFRDWTHTLWTGSRLSSLNPWTPREVLHWLSEMFERNTIISTRHPQTTAHSSHGFDINLGYIYSDDIKSLQSWVFSGYSNKKQIPCENQSRTRKEDCNIPPDSKFLDV